MTMPRRLNFKRDVDARGQRSAAAALPPAPVSGEGGGEGGGEGADLQRHDNPKSGATARRRCDVDGPSMKLYNCLAKGQAQTAALAVLQLIGASLLKLGKQPSAVLACNSGAVVVDAEANVD